MFERINLRPGDPLREAGFVVKRGWNDTLASRLADTDKEFDTDTIDEWFEATQPTVYSLARAAQLAGIIWYSTENHTTVPGDYLLTLRMYDSAPARRLRGPFLRAADSDFKLGHPSEHVVIETAADASDVREACFKQGFRIVKATSAHITLHR